MWKIRLRLIVFIRQFIRTWTVLETIVLKFTIILFTKFVDQVAANTGRNTNFESDKSKI